MNSAASLISVSVTVSGWPVVQRGRSDFVSDEDDAKPNAIGCVNINQSAHGTIVYITPLASTMW